ncbi:hypothetical protein JTB14_029104 [Gonioctena quinquepunctata]|nr:hypothetical protein JTB14_029104 [Gonioctena quinquepunctata]
MTDQGPRNLAAPSTSEVATRTEKMHKQFRSNNIKRTYQNEKDESDRKFVSSKQVNAAILEAETNSTMRNLQQLDNQEVPGNDGWTQVKYNKKRKYLVGQSEQTGEIETVPKMVTLHVTRLKPNTKPNELKKFLEKSLPDIQCEPHTSKRPDIYSSMRITIKREDFKNAWRREVWPNGALVSFFAQKRMQPTVLMDPRPQESIQINAKIQPN